MALHKTTFYGRDKRKQDLDLKVRLAKREKLNQVINLPKKFNPSILGPTHLWKICHTQKEAFQLSRLKVDLHVFSFESESFQENVGKRLFLVTSYEEFWHYYSQLKTSQRHHYEVIPEGSVCHLYFDLEFYKASNPEACGSAMTVTLIKFVLLMLQLELDLQCDESNVLQLDASTDVKFSRHLIFHLPGAAFKDNVQMGHFINHIFDTLEHYLAESLPDNEVCGEEAPAANNKGSHPVLTKERLQEYGLTLSDLQSLTVSNNDGKRILFCDTGVYTKNRNFRLFLSSKLGKNNPLVVADNNQYVAKTVTTSVGKTGSLNQRIFLDSLIARVGYTDDMKILTFSKTGQRHNTTCNVTPETADTSGVHNVGSMTGDDVIESHNHESPYPEIDRFVASVINKGGVEGSIRRWLFFAQGQTLLYDIAKNRWCENIGRHHRSNNIMIVVDLVKGVYYQKCHDPECKKSNYRSNDYPIPREVTELYNPSDSACNWSQFDDDISDELLMSLLDVPGSHGINDNTISEQSEDINCDESNIQATDGCVHVLDYTNTVPSKKAKLSDGSQETCTYDVFDQEATETITDEHLLQIVEKTEKQLEKVE